MRSLDFVGKKLYTYNYEDGKIVQSTESDLTVENGETITAKVLVNTVYYYYDQEGTLVKKRILPIGGTEQLVYYEKAENDSQVVKFTAGGRTVTSHSKTDSFGRKVFDELRLGTGFVSRQFHYLAGEATEKHVANNMLKSTPTTQLVSQIVLSGGTTLSYGYDAEERITSVVESYTVDETLVTNTTTYTYDALGQLETETSGGKTIKFEYDNYGNIVAKGLVDDNGEIADETKISYVYGNGTWRDLLTSYNGLSISYDAQGNPTSYLGHTLTWEKGRQLKQFDSNVYTYNANGIRTSKTITTADEIEEHRYILDGTKILREVWGDNSLIPLYDNEDNVCGIIYNDVPYYFQKDLQGDIIAITDQNGNTIARYSYDAWGVCTIVQDTTVVGIAAINPFRYRGYYYDAEIGMYYLQSRYYNPAVGIFVNADAAMFAIVGNGILEHNLFAYCKNEPVKNSDPSGHWTEYWGTFNATAINNFSAKLDNRAESIRKKFWWVKWAGFALGIIVGIITGFFLSPIGGAVVGAGVSLATMGIEKLIDLYPSELNSISRSVRNGYNAIKRSLIIYFLFGSHSNQIKIVNSSTKKTYSKISIRTNAIGDLVAYAKNSGVKISSKTVSWKYSY